MTAQNRAYICDYRPDADGGYEPAVVRALGAAVANWTAESLGDGSCRLVVIGCPDELDAAIMAVRGTDRAAD